MSVGPAQVAADADALLGLRLADLNARRTPRRSRDAGSRAARRRARDEAACVPELRGEGGGGATTEPKTAEAEA